MLCWSWVLLSTIVVSVARSPYLSIIFCMLKSSQIIIVKFSPNLKFEDLHWCLASSIWSFLLTKFVNLQNNYWKKLAPSQTSQFLFSSFNYNSFECSTFGCQVHSSFREEALEIGVCKIFNTKVCSISNYTKGKRQFIAQSIHAVFVKVIFQNIWCRQFILTLVWRNEKWQFILTQVWRNEK